MAADRSAEWGEFLNALKFKDISVQVSARKHLPKTPARAGAVTAVTQGGASQFASQPHSPAAKFAVSCRFPARPR
jgi:hypothetical protein